MRITELFTSGWYFLALDLPVPPTWADVEAHGTAVMLPHTWNAIDGQDGGNDYHRGRCWYAKRFTLDPDPEKEYWLEFRGANSVADVWLNGVHLGQHAGGYSTFRFDATAALRSENLLCVAVDNSPNDAVYPQWADFTFYGGIYREVILIEVPTSHFALDLFGGPGVRVEAVMDGADARVTLTAHVTGGRAVRFSIDGVAGVTVPVSRGMATAELVIEQAHVWHGRRDPFLYTVTAELIGEDPDNVAYDSVSLRFGCRTVAVDPDAGFLLNGQRYPLRGASRHQDWLGVGNAISPAMMRTDIELLLEMGATSVRLAHYQHDQAFYDLCDEVGIVVWAEIPYVSGHHPSALANAASQLTELIEQNRHHASIACWGLSNEITVQGNNEEALAGNSELNALAHRLDPARLTALAHFFLLDTADPLVALPDASGYNLYYGWYVGDLEDNDRWFAEFRVAHPAVPIALTEYGADANPAYQSANPRQGDYSEQYQAVYHEHMVELIESSGYLWASYVWNLADFGADARAEGGIPGRNQKGLVTMDRAIKKDAFYVYKAAWSTEPFVHIAGRRYVERAEAVTEICVYSNCSHVALWCDDKLIGQIDGRRAFRFQVPIEGKHIVTARADTASDSIEVRRVAQPNPAYLLAQAGTINWVDKDNLPCPAGFFSINDTLGDVRRSPEGGRLVDALLAEASAARADMAAEVQLTPAIERMIARQTVASVLHQAGVSFPAEKVADLNAALNRIRK